MLLATEKKLTWDGRSIARGESLPSIFRKVAFRNRVSILELLNLVGSEGESLRYSKIKFPARSNYFRALTGCPEDVLAPTLTHYLLGVITPQQTERYRCSRFRYCPSCLLKGYHSELFQLNFLVHCPVHGEKLIERCRGCGHLVENQRLDGQDDRCSCGFLLAERPLRSSWHETERGPERLFKIIEWLHINVAETHLALHTVCERDGVKDLILEYEHKVRKPIVVQFDLIGLWSAALGSTPPPEFRKYFSASEAATCSVALKSATQVPYPLAVNYRTTRSHLEAINVRHDVLAGNVRLMQLEPRGLWRINPFLRWRSFWEQSDRYIYAEDDPEEFECILDGQLAKLFDFCFWRGPTFSTHEIQRIFCHVLVKTYSILCHRAVEENLGPTPERSDDLSPIAIHNNRLFSFRWPQMPLNSCRLGGRRDAVAEQVLEGFDLQSLETGNVRIYADLDFFL